MSKKIDIGKYFIIEKQKVFQYLIYYAIEISQIYDAFYNSFLVL